MQSQQDASRSPALFLDRDGIINIDKNYVHKISDFEFVEGIFDICAIAQRHEIPIVVATNQAGIARGYYTEDEFHNLSDWMKEQFKLRGITIDAIYYCPYHPESGIGRYRRFSEDRKPGPGMLLRAKYDMGLDLKNSLMLGDKMSDIEAARRAGVGYTVLVSNSFTEKDAKSTLVTPNAVVENLKQASSIVEEWAAWCVTRISDESAHVAS